jgi:chorismate dehydratase
MTTGGPRPRVGRIAYLNVQPFFHAFPWPVVTALPPRALGEALAGGMVDAGPLALADVIRLGSLVSPLPFGIAAWQGAQSVFVFADRPLRELGGARIAVTGETSTSVRLLRILLAFRYEAAPPLLVAPDAVAEADLVIGDAALRALRRPPRPLVIDLGLEWTAWTGLPAVFATWAIRRDVPPGGAAALAEALEASLRVGLARLPEIAAGYPDLGLTPAEVVTYLSRFTYRLGPDEDKAAAEFRRLLALLPP